MAVLIVFDPSDASTPAPGGKAPEYALALTPSAYLAARDKGWTVRRSSDVFDDEAHKACVAAGSQALREFDSAMQTSKVPDAVRLMGRHICWQLAVIAARLRYTLPDAPTYVRPNPASNSWNAAETATDAAAILLPRIYRAGQQHLLSAGRPKLPKLFNLLTSVAAAWWGLRQPSAFSSSRKLKLGMGQALERAGFKVGSVNVSVGGWTDYAQLFSNLRSGNAALRIAPLLERDVEVQRSLKEFEGVERVFSDLFQRIAWKKYLAIFRINLPIMLAICRDGPRLLRQAKADLAICFDAHTWDDAAVLQAARDIGLPRVVVNHNSHPWMADGPASDVLATLLHHRCFHPLVSRACTWTPQTVQWGGYFAKERGIDVPLERFNASYPRTRGKRTRFRILHAGNYQNWSDFFPWISETSDEFVNGVSTLASIVAGISDIEMTIRIRPKLEVNAQVVEQLIPSAPNIVLSGTEKDFLEELAECDMLVSHYSTTVEQALQMGKPVLLWGSTQRFCQFLPSWNLPTQASRSAVYAVRDTQALPGMLKAIRDHHWKRPLSAQEVAQYRNRPEDPQLDGLAARMLAL